MAVEDPETPVGSGGATLNALLVATEYLSARAGHTVVTADVLQRVHVLIVHIGTPRLADVCGKAFLPLAAESDVGANLLTNVDLLLKQMTHIRQSESADPGVWVCSTDMLLTFDLAAPLAWPCAVCCQCFHGVYQLDQDGNVLDLIYRGTESERAHCAQDHGYPLVVGLIYFAQAVAETLLALHVMPPLDACTYLGLDNGASPFRLSLFLDLVRAALPAAKGDRFLDCASPLSPHAHATIAGVAQAVRVPALPVMPVPGFTPKPHVHYVGLTATSIERSANRFGDAWVPRRASLRQHLTHGRCVINSVMEESTSLGEQCTVLHTQTSCRVRAIYRAFDAPALGAIRRPHLLRLNPTLFLFLPSFADVAVIGLTLAPDKLGCAPNSTYLGQPWTAFLARTGLHANDLWRKGERPCLQTARLFPIATSEAWRLSSWLQAVFSADDCVDQIEAWRFRHRISLQEALHCVDLSQQLRSRHDLYDKIATHNLEHALCAPERQDYSAMVSLQTAHRQPRALIGCLHTVAMQTGSPGVAAHALACVASMLGAMCHGRGGLRSGPGRNARFAAAYECLDRLDVRGGVQILAAECDRWLDSPEKMIRASRHYESAAQILIRHAVMTARQFITVSQRPSYPLGRWAVARVPARLDLAGGWSDTPPLTYEHGGVVTNVAILIDGQRPIGAKCRRISEPKLVLVLVGDPDEVLELTELEQLRNYTQPQAPGALLKAAFCCVEAVDLDDPRPLREQLLAKFGGGFELHSWSHLPQGSGLGTSSILAGAVMAALSATTGREYDRVALNHAVLHLEQMLTTGGGWQDQVGGMDGGIKLTRSPPGLPLKIEVDRLSIEPTFLQALSDHLVLIYTGKTRLARNLLQNVIRNWYARTAEIVANVDALTVTAEECAEACLQQDMVKVGQCVDAYWAQKKVMAPGCEPAFVARMMAAFKPHVYGQALAGAGGGGFMFALAKSAADKAKMQWILANDFAQHADVVFHQVAIDPEGLVVVTEEAESTDLD
ncbi:uncharacterized protein MONBRDRAFT_15021 [Monosiga brevicollis MX1]|uniref:L-fucose kinase n=1 Tax=Monosiga brevicollis TaxID=81824 RepID=A9UTS0_MONBE|nr:uncharacterized protein MONBRDRAFT_15021 [Monosiga brevicollis MX1]EDQ91540.1 predicted protein [Monosiga brevicollis MX1]|eukprot:XP_001743962.1 hypothetical protein [Monosiga brevicollis MX1]